VVIPRIPPLSGLTLVFVNVNATVYVGARPSFLRYSRAPAENHRTPLTTAMPRGRTAKPLISRVLSL
jgi:hypothetical protein